MGKQYVRLQYIVRTLLPVFASLLQGLLALPFAFWTVFRATCLPPVSLNVDALPRRKTLQQHNREVARLVAAVDSARKREQKCAISRKPKGTGTTARSNLYKYDVPIKLDLSQLDCLLDIDIKNRTATVEPGVTVSSLASETLQFGLLPPVCPELRKITIGGAIQGMGIESTSLHWRTVDTHVLDAHLLVAKTDESEHAGIVRKSDDAELWQTTVGSCGSISLVTQATIRLLPATRWIKLRYVRYPDHKGFVEEVMRKRANHKDGEESWISDDILADAISFDHCTIGMYGGCVSEAEAAAWRGPVYQDHAARPFFYQHVEYISRLPIKNSSEERKEHGELVYEELWPTLEYIVRYDRGGFWAALVVAQLLKPLRLILDITILRFFFTSILSTSTLMSLTHCFRDTDVENLALFQDVSVPLTDNGRHVDEFMTWLHDVRPVWLCPIRTQKNSGRVFATADDAETHDCEMDIGFYGVPKQNKNTLRQINLELEDRMAACNGKKGLYAFCYKSRQTFWSWYSKERYDNAREIYGGNIVWVDLYDKCASTLAHR